MFATKCKGILHFDNDENLVTQQYFSTKEIVEAFANHLFFILGTNRSSKRQIFKKHKLMVRRNKKYLLHSVQEHQKIHLDTNSRFKSS